MAESRTDTASPDRSVGQDKRIVVGVVSSWRDNLYGTPAVRRCACVMARIYVMSERRGLGQEVHRCEDEPAVKQVTKGSGRRGSVGIALQERITTSPDVCGLAVRSCSCRTTEATTTRAETRREVRMSLAPASAKRQAMTDPRPCSGIWGSGGVRMPD